MLQALFISLAVIVGVFVANFVDFVAGETFHIVAGVEPAPEGLEAEVFVESAPGKKDPAEIERFLAAVAAL